MIHFLVKFLGGEAGEEKKILLLLGNGFFLGVMLATYKVGAETLFVDVLGKERLDEAFFVTGLLGILSAGGFVYLQRRINFSSLVLSFNFVVMLILIGLRLSFHLNHYEINTTYQEIIFTMFVLVGPVTSISFLGFWGIFGRMFDVRQAKRIVGGIDTGQLFATLVAFFSIPLLFELHVLNLTYDLLLVSSAASIGVFCFTLFLVINFNIDRVTKRVKGKKEVSLVQFENIFKDKYLRLLGIFVLFSMASSVFASYTFLSASGTFYETEQELTNFFSFFGGTVIIVSFLFQSFFNDYIIARFGLKVALMIMPLLLIAFTVGAIISGQVFGYEEKTETYLLYFLFTASAKLFTDSLKDALESPAFKLFFLPIDVKIRFDIQTRIEGVISEFAKLSAGTLQIGLGLLAFFELIHFSYFILALAGMVIYMSWRLFKQYKITLKQTLEKQKEILADKGKRNEDTVLNLVERQLLVGDTERSIQAFKALEKLDPFGFERAMIKAIGSRSPYIRSHAYKKIGDYLPLDHLSIIERTYETEGDSDVLGVANPVMEKLRQYAVRKWSKDDLLVLIRSTEADNRILAARILHQQDETQKVAFNIELLRDINPEVRLAAILAAGKIKRPELWGILLENLHLPAYSNAALSALVEAKAGAYDLVDSAFYRTGQYRATMVRVLQLFGRVGGQNAIDLLWKKIDYPDKRVVNELLLSLSYLGFQAKEFQIARIKVMIEKEIGGVAWNVKVMEEIPKHTSLDGQIRSAVRAENKANYDHIFMLLAMIYDAQNVMLVKQNIEIGSSESISFAIEMLDVFIAEELKSRLFPILDELKIEDRLARLRNHYPPEIFEDYLDLLLQIVNRDYNRINRFTKTLALFRISQLAKRVNHDLVAILFNNDVLLRQTAAYAIYTIDKEAYHHHTDRLDYQIKKELDRAIVPPVFKRDDDDFHYKMLYVERLLLLINLRIFEKVPGVQLTYLAERMGEIRVPPETSLIEVGDPGDKPLYIILDGKVRLKYDDESVKELGEKSFFGERLLLATDHFPFTAKAMTNVKLLVIKKEDLIDLMSNFKEMAEAVMQMLHEGVMYKEEETSADLFI